MAWCLLISPDCLGLQKAIPGQMYPSSTPVHQCAATQTRHLEGLFAKTERLLSEGFTVFVWLIVFVVGLVCFVFNCILSVLRTSI